MRFATAFILAMLAPAPGHAQSYFPSGILGNSPQANDAAAQLYSRCLEAVHEPSLWDWARQDPKAEAYRLIWLRAFDRPLSLRLALKPGGTGWFYRRMTSGKGGSPPGRMAEWGMSWSWKSRTTSFVSMVDGSGFWSLPALDAAGNSAISPPSPAAPYRSHWILEGIRNGQYHVVDRFSPAESDPVRVIGTRMLKLGGVRVHGSQVY